MRIWRKPSRTNTTSASPRNACLIWRAPPPFNLRRAKSKPPCAKQKAAPSAPCPAKAQAQPERNLRGRAPRPSQAWLTRPLAPRALRRLRTLRPKPPRARPCAFDGHAAFARRQPRRKQPAQKRVFVCFWRLLATARRSINGGHVDGHSDRGGRRPMPLLSPPLTATESESASYAARLRASTSSTSCPLWVFCPGARPSGATISAGLRPRADSHMHFAHSACRALTRKPLLARASLAHPRRPRASQATASDMKLPSSGLNAMVLQAFVNAIPLSPHGKAHALQGSIAISRKRSAPAHRSARPIQASQA